MIEKLARLFGHVDYDLTIPEMLLKAEIVDTFDYFDDQHFGHFRNWGHGVVNREVLICRFHRPMWEVERDWMRPVGFQYADAAVLLQVCAHERTLNFEIMANGTNYPLGANTGWVYASGIPTLIPAKRKVILTAHYSNKKSGLYSDGSGKIFALMSRTTK
ncbi:MAG: hypothetical protein A2751_03895 [Candidatus Doudnabacteria bacterium RIFCSPHIGHO2_01_FULL_46_14]|uniref:Uncharacterized protein n=1 Tax=Candidatus Doudnabacteria bacterium RIFCSPHIGHO2_01_FULL_46_14 TaxID=1817824 RepID=A0A1F5NKN8_9BACT|nr:MAG: hypothetical protein A2751_03895 [Candidatus Doudnabacteria bacterium RIFCSPHIGHO2_01_FULL_46_14]